VWLLLLPAAAAAMLGVLFLLSCILLVNLFHQLLEPVRDRTAVGRAAGQ
jgi:hypothetical protein